MTGYSLAWHTRYCDPNTVRCVVMMRAGALSESLVCQANE